MRPADSGLEPAAFIPRLQKQLAALKGQLIARGLGSPDLFRALERLVNASVRGAAAGLILRGGLHLVSQTLSLVLSSKRKGKRGVTLQQAARDTLKYVAFLGSLGGVYVAVDEGIAAVFGKTRTSAWRALLAGACAGPSLLWIGSGSTRQYSLSTYIFLRGLTLLVRCGNRPTSPPLLRTLLAPTRATHGDTLLMCAAASQILYSFICMPHSLPGAYVRFLNKHAAKDPSIWAACRELTVRNSTGLAPGPLAALLATPHSAHSHPTPCGFLHPSQTCTSHALSSVPVAWLRALQVYLPVYVLPAILVHRKKLLQQPQLLWPKIAAGVARSSLFLSLYIGLAFAGVCTGHQLLGRSTGGSIAASVALSGLATLAEKKSRRMELALYCCARALESCGHCMVEWGWVGGPGKAPLRMDVVLFSAAVAAIMHCYSGDNGAHRDVFRSKYLNWFDFVFGNRGMKEGRITHVPSNLDLFTSLERRARLLMPRSSSSPALHSSGSPPPTPNHAHAASIPTPLPSAFANPLAPYPPPPKPIDVAPTFRLSRLAHDPPGHARTPLQTMPSIPLTPTASDTPPASPTAANPTTPAETAPGVDMAT